MLPKPQETVRIEAHERADAQQREFQAFLQSDPYQNAIRQETDSRDLAFIDLPETVSGLKLRQLTGRDLLILTVLRSPFLARSFISGHRDAADMVPREVTEDWMESHIYIHPREVAKFLWIQSISFVPRGTLWAWTKWYWFMRRCQKLVYGETCKAIRMYLDDALADKPCGKGIPGTAFTSWLAGDVTFLASKFHWSEREILELPIKRLFQYERSILESAGQKSAIGNRSDSLKAEFSRSINEQRKARN